MYSSLLSKDQWCTFCVYISFGFDVVQLPSVCMPTCISSSFCVSREVEEEEKEEGGGLDYPR